MNDKLSEKAGLMAEEHKNKVGDKVQDTGNYVCDNCGHYQYFEKTDEFEDCHSCYEPDINWEEEE